MRRATITAALTLAVVALLAAPAAAHVTADPDTAPAGGRVATGFTIDHGCDGSPTTEVEVGLPEGVESVTPRQMPGWSTSVEDDRVRWEADAGNELADHEFASFGLRLVTPDAEGERLYFPTVQTCVEGEYRWTEVPDEEAGESWGELATPAPYLDLVAGDDDHGHSHGDEDEGSDHGHDHDEGADDEGTDAAAGDDEALVGDGDEGAGVDGDEGAEGEADAGVDGDADDLGEGAERDEDAANGDDAPTAEETGPDGELAAATSDGGLDAMTLVALTLGAVALVVAAGALFAARQRQP